MIIKKIILDNFKTHKHLEIEPAIKGITSITGTNGAGKSSIVDAIAWVLYGTKTIGNKNQDYIREGVSAKSSTVQVKIFFLLGNQEVTVTRRIINDSGSAQCRVFVKEINSKEDFVEVAGPSVSHAEQFIRRLIGLDEKGFLTSVFIQQKQVDNIIDASPMTRGQVIEKMIGIDSLTNSIQEGKVESRELQKALSIIQVGNIEEEKERVLKQKTIVEETQKENLTLKEELKEKKETFEKYKELLVKEDKKRENYKILLNEYKNTETLLKEKKKTLKEDIEILKTIKIKTIKAPLDELAEKNIILKDNLDKINKTIAENEIRMNNIEKILNQDFDSFLISQESDLLDEKVKIEEELKKIKEEKNEKDFTEKTNKNLLKLIKDEKGYCPTCGSNLCKQENKEEHLKEIKEKVLSLKDEIKILNENILTKTEKLKEIEEKLNTIKKFKEIEESQKVAIEEKKELFEERISLEDEKSLLEAEYNTIKKLLQDYNNNKEKETFRETLKNKIQVLDDEVDTLNKKLKLLTDEKEKSFEALDRNFKIKKEENDILNKEIIELLKRESQLQEKLKQEKEKGQLVLKIYKDCLQAKENFSNISNSLLIVNQSIDSLAKFKEERLYSSIPALVEITTDILNRFTNGAFIEFILDKNFNCSIRTEKGLIRPHHKLSGGEKSMLAIALRFAISIFLNNNSGTLMILDEVLVSMAEEPSMKILEVIQSMKDSQIILIAHNDFIEKIAEKTIEL